MCGNEQQLNFLFFADACGKTSMTLETLRQCISRGEVLVSDGSHFKLFQSRSINYLATCSVPEASDSYWISPRLSRLFVILTLPSMTSETLFSIHSSKLQPWLKEIQPTQSLADRANCIITSTLDVYLAVRECYTVASSPNFIFSLHDIHKVFQGMYLWRSRLDGQQALRSSFGFRSYSLTEKSVSFPSVIEPDLNIVRLWMHECLRTFGDRLDSEDACRKLISIIAEVSKKNFGTMLSTESQTLPADTSSPTDVLSVTSTYNINQQLDSSSSQMEENLIPWLVKAEVQTESEETNVESNSSLHSTGIDEDGFSYTNENIKNAGNFENDPGTSELKSESSSCSFPMLFSSLSSHSVENYVNQKPSLNEEFLQRLRETASSIQNVVFSPELCETSKNILLHHNFKRTCVYKERNVDMLVNQLVHTLKIREENKDEKSDTTHYNPKWAVHHQNVHQLVHVIRAVLIPGGHGALFGGAKKTGRKTIVRLAAALTGYQLVEVQSGNETKLWGMMKDIWSQTGVNAGHLVLLVHENTSQAVKDQLLVMMANGSFPGLYSEEELKNVTMRMKALMKDTHCYLKDDQALEM